MIDLHSHLLPGIDDGARDLDSSLEMARIAVADGIRVMACTPHIQVGGFQNDPDDIRKRVVALQEQLDSAGIALRLVTGSDAHVRPDFVQALRENRLLSINETRYVLFEPPHHVAPPRMDALLFDILVAGYVPIVTHPERLTWIAKQYDVLPKLVQAGVWMQVTSGSITGRFGSGPKELAKRMLADGLVHILATDAHSARRRPPLLREGMEAAAEVVGQEEAQRMVLDRPRTILENGPSAVTLTGATKPNTRPKSRGIFASMFARS